MFATVRIKFEFSVFLSLLGRDARGMLRNHERYGGAVLIALMMLVLLLLCQLGAFLAVGASRAKANIGGAESAMDKVARDLELKQRVQQMANEGRETQCDVCMFAYKYVYVSYYTFSNIRMRKQLRIFIQNI